jgi:anti-sigma B factor antagonist
LPLFWDNYRKNTGGEGEIRTPGTLRPNGFRDRRIQPLCHLSTQIFKEIYCTRISTISLQLSFWAVYGLRKIVTNVRYVVEYKSIFQEKDSVMDEFLSIEKIGDVTVVRFSFNEINRDQREEIKQGLQKLMDAGERKFIIDLTKVGFISSLVIATIIFFAKQVKENGGAIKISGLSSEAFSIFQLTQLDKVLDLYESESDALENF